ncbi:hypothetical protein HCN51_18460 [Nonomuraea sp. FMUSA5-5]|uniref:Uncharacterized protein n=1 Tax=Nonomuraea composti TaxID=2720023 RepID=A0ABX1B0P0_9ACTN|nr:hypothetical protein [Nonomuraea sp. FMUSA5-5]NJP91418.1 hypothetical protein [Nonomuraea sp. FMUSA5-5]
MLDEWEATALAALLRELADRIGDDRLGAEARRMADALRERLGGGGRGGVMPGEDAEARRNRAAGRDQEAEQRDRAARRRDEEAEQRDAAAVERDREAHAGQERTDAADRAFHDVLWAAEQRDHAVDERDAGGPGDGGESVVVRQQWRDAREHSHEDRTMLREQWEGTVRRQRREAQTGEQAARQDRRQSHEDRRSAALDRAAAESDRDAALADREQDEIECQMLRPPRPDHVLQRVRDARERARAGVERARQAREQAVEACRRAERLQALCSAVGPIPEAEQERAGE